MARIEYCEDEIIKGWHPAYAIHDLCGYQDEWGYLLAVEDYVLDSFIDDYEEQQFQELAARWKRETALDSHLYDIVMNEDYQRIMASGSKMIPFILRDLARKPAHWFWALHNLVPEGEDPAEGLTTIEEARQAWLRWGRDNGYL